jgi:anti-sigma factor RsiW
MDCEQAQLAILEAVDTAATMGLPPLVDGHVSACGECTRFAARQRRADARLAAALESSALSPAFRTHVHDAMRGDQRWFMSDRLPEMVHFVSCGIATLGAVFLLPFTPTIILGGGAAGALLSYVLLATVRSSFEDIEQPLH